MGADTELPSENEAFQPLRVASAREILPLAAEIPKRVKPPV